VRKLFLIKFLIFIELDFNFDHKKAQF